MATTPPATPADQLDQLLDAYAGAGVVTQDLLKLTETQRAAYLASLAAAGGDITARAQLNTLINLREAKGPIFALFVGDSLTFGNNDNINGVLGAGSYATQVAWRSKGRIVTRKNIGIPGQNSTQIVQRFADEGLFAPGIEVAFLLQGTNDLIQSVAQTTTVRNDRLAIRAIKARGLRAIVIAIPPNNANGAGANALNVAKQAVAIAEGAIWIDPWGAARASDGTYVSGASADGIHPNQIQCAMAAEVILADAQIVPLLPRYGILSVLSNGELNNPISAFDGTYTGGLGPTPNGFSSYGSAGASSSVAPDPVSGVNLMTINSGPTGGAVVQSNSLNISALAGRRISFSGRVRSVGLQASGGTFSIDIKGFNDAAETTSLNFIPLGGLTVDGDGCFYAEYQLPAGATTAQVTAQIQGVTSGGASVTFGELTLRVVPDFQGLDTRTNRQPERIRHLSASTTVTIDDAIILVDATAGPVTITLPDPRVVGYGFGPYAANYQRRTTSSGLRYTIKKIDSSANAVTVAGPAGATFEGATTLSLTTQWQAANLLSAKAGLFVKNA